MSNERPRGNENKVNRAPVNDFGDAIVWNTGNRLQLEYLPSGNIGKVVAREFTPTTIVDGRRTPASLAQTLILAAVASEDIGANSKNLKKLLVYAKHELSIASKREQLEAQATMRDLEGKIF